MEYLDIIPKIAKYLANTKIQPIFKKKNILLAAGGEKDIYIFNNCLEFSNSLIGHQAAILDIIFLSPILLASGSMDKRIIIWDFNTKSTYQTDNLHKEYISTLCHPRENLLISGSGDMTLIFWELFPGEPPHPIPNRVLIGHTSQIIGIIYIYNTNYIISGDQKGSFRLWDMDEGNCIRYIHSLCGGITQIKYIYGRVAYSTGDKLIFWSTGIDDIYTINVKCGGFAIEFLTSDICLRGTVFGQLGIIHILNNRLISEEYIELHSGGIEEILKLAQGIVAIAHRESSIKIIDPVAKKLYFEFNKMEGEIYSLAKVY